MDAMMITGGQGFTGRHITQRLAAGGRRAIFGLLTRWISLALLPVMSGALLTHLPNGWTFTNKDGGWEYIAFLMVALLVQAALGDGALALGSVELNARRLTSNPLSPDTSKTEPSRELEIRRRT